MHSVWNISYSHIESEDGDAPRLLKLGAYFDNKGIWYEFLRPGWDG